MLPITNLSSSSMVEEMVCAAQIESLLVAYPSSRSTGGLTYKPWLITWMNLPPKSEHLVVKMEPPHITFKPPQGSFWSFRFHHAPISMPWSATAMACRWQASGNLPSDSGALGFQSIKQCIIHIWKINFFDMLDLESKKHMENQWTSWHINQLLTPNYSHGQHDIRWCHLEKARAEWDCKRLAAGCGHENNRKEMHIKPKMARNMTMIYHGMLTL